MDVLFLCHRIPFPPNKGDKIRSQALLTHLARNHRVHLACFVDDPADMVHCDAVRKIARGECIFLPLTSTRKWMRAATACIKGQPITTTYLNCRRLHRWIGALVSTQRIDCCFVFSSGMASYLLRGSELDSAHAILDMVDLDSDKWRQYAKVMSFPQRWIFGREAERLERFERAAAAEFGATILVSGYEADSFRRIAPESADRVFAITNGVDLDYFTPGKFVNPFSPGEVPVVMTGRMDYRPNIDAVEWFAREVLSRLKSKLPGVRFHAVGANPPRRWRGNNAPDVSVSEDVYDVRPYIQHAACVVAPLRIARGIQNKLLEAMAMARPIVATHEATRSLAVQPGLELLVENDADAFATAVAMAMGRSDLGENARRYVEQYHNWQRNLVELDHIMAAVAESRRPPADVRKQFAIAEPAQ